MFRERALKVVVVVLGFFSTRGFILSPRLYGIPMPRKIMATT